VIPKVAHFIWLTPEFPWVNVLALESAALHGGFERLVLHHSREFDPERYGAELARVPRLELRALDVTALCSGLAPEQRAPMQALYRRLSRPAAQSNVLRVLVLASEGGVYLDMDTVTVRSLGPLCERVGAFCGAERIAFPGEIVNARRPFSYALGVLRSGVRGVLSRLPRGYSVFRSIERFYPLSANNAVLGARAHHPFSSSLAAGMLALSEERALRRFALGTHLLQAALREYGGDDLEVLGPGAFYPLGPEISQHWFRIASRAELSQVLSDETRVVHWYASLRTREQQRELTRERVRELAPRQLFSALALRYGGE
jgi:hypothetical protein